MQQFTRTVIRNSAYGLIAQIAIKVLSFGFSVLIVRHLGVESYGQYAGVLAFGAMFAFLGDLGLSPYAVREIARFREEPQGLLRIANLYGNVLALRFVLSLLAAILLVLTAWLTGRPLLMIGAIGLGACGLMLYGIQGASDSVLAGFEQLALSARAKVSNQLAFVLIGALALLLGSGYYGLVLANILGVALMTLLCWKSVRSLGVVPQLPSLRCWPALLRASFPFGLISLAISLSYKFDSVLLNIYRGDVETGYYNAAYNLIFSVVMLSNVFNTAIYPSLARWSVGNAHDLPAIYARTLRYLLVLALPVTVGIWCVADQLVPFLFGATYLPVAQALRILIWVVPFMFASEFLGYIVVIAGKEQRVANAVLISTGLNIGFNVLIVPHFGFRGAAIMTVATEVILVGQYAWLLRALLRKLSWGDILVRPLLAALVMGMIVLFAHLPLQLRIMLGAMIYGVLLLAFGVVGKEELALCGHYIGSWRRMRRGII